MVVNCRNIPISNNVGSVKYVFEHTSVCTHRRAPFRSRGWFARFQPGLALNRQGQELGPTQPSLRSLTAIKIVLFELPHSVGAGCPIVTSVIYSTPVEMSALSRVRSELLLMTVVATLAPHPLQVHRQFPRHRYFRDLPSSSQGEVEECAAPLGTAAHRTCALPCPEGGDVLRVRHFCKSFSEPLATISPIDATRWRSSGWRPIASSHAALPTLW